MNGKELGNAEVCPLEHCPGMRCDIVLENRPVRCGLTLGRRTSADHWLKPLNQQNGILLLHEKGSSEEKKLRT